MPNAALLIIQGRNFCIGKGSQSLINLSPFAPRGRREDTTKSLKANIMPQDVAEKLEARLERSPLLLCSDIMRLQWLIVYLSLQLKVVMAIFDIFHRPLHPGKA
jgi:hypothetical protein